MQKLKLLTLILFLSQYVFSQITVSVKKLNRVAPAKSDTIYYNNSSKLNWKNFTGTPQLSSGAAAITTSGFGYAASISYDEDGGNAEIGTYCFFSKKKSWVKPGNKNAYTLAHEQKHFDITYIGYCNFLSKIEATKFSTSETFNKDIEKVYKECYATMRKMQDDYDTETKNGILKDKQQEWIDRINTLLATQKKLDINSK